MRVDFSAGVGGAQAASRLLIGQDSVSGHAARTFRGFSASEAAVTPAAAEFRLHDGTTAGGSLLAVAKLTASGNLSVFVPWEGEELTTDSIFLEVISGSVRGVVYYG